MATSVTINLRGLRRKAANIRRLRDALTFVHQDAAAWFQLKLINEIINGQFVGVITGNLRRSHAVLPAGKDRTIILVPQSAPAAPYAGLVAQRTKNRYGQTYLELTKFFFEGDIVKFAQKEFSRAIASINANRIYKYKNPYPAN